MKIAYLFIFLLFAMTVSAQERELKDSLRNETLHRFNLHFQTTYIYQYKPSFHSPYSALHSLSGKAEKANSLTATLFLGLRLWKGAAFFVNPEIAGGNGLSGSYGLSASTNGEIYRVGNPSPTLYMARVYLSQTIPLSKDCTTTADAANQFSTAMPKNYLQFQVGKYSLSDLFDNNTFSNSPRTQFLNWAIMNNGAWDYAADVRGYTDAFSTTLQLNNFSYKTAVSLLPITANSPTLNYKLNEEFAINSEISQAYKINGKQGNIRVLGYYNYGNFGEYKQALSDADKSGSIPDIVDSRAKGRKKIGIGFSADQQVYEDLGLFVRVGMNDGKTETFCYTEADQTISAGLTVNGEKWHRKNDVFGVAFVVNGISKVHEDYLAKGGLGFELGDGKLNYGREKALESYYSLKPAKGPISLSANYQFIMNPGYNKDRGPVNVFSFRLHVEF